MEVRGQPHAPSTLSSEKVSVVHTDSEDLWALELVWTRWRKESVCYSNIKFLFSLHVMVFFSFVNWLNTLNRSLRSLKKNHCLFKPQSLLPYRPETGSVFSWFAIDFTLQDQLWVCSYQALVNCSLLLTQEVPSYTLYLTPYKLKFFY
jgi:hypothetical protein